MDNNPRYARTLVQGTVRVLWQRTPAAVAKVIAETAFDLYAISRSDEIEPFDRQ